MFRSLAHQWFEAQEEHKTVRNVVISQLRRRRSWYEGFQDPRYEDYDEYLQRMAGNGEWGDNTALQAFADALGCRIQLITSFNEPLTEVIPRERRTETTLYIAFWSEMHYDSIVPL